MIGSVRFALTLSIVSLASGCSVPDGVIKIDGSSTVYLITESMVTDFKKLHPGIDVSVGIAGTGGGFKKFAAGETDISNASRKVKSAEAEACAKHGISFIELQVAWDGLAVVINKDNDWARQMTVEQLKKIWRPDSPAQNWSDVDPSWPNEPIQLYGPGPDSGTFDYFTGAINGKERLSRKDYTASEDDNSLVTGVARNKYALGYFGLAYYEPHRDKLVAVAVAEKPGGPFVEPSPETVLNNTYKPLSRPLFIYVRNDSLERPEIREFVKFYLRRTDLVEASGYVPLSATQRWAQTQKLQAALGE